MLARYSATATTLAITSPSHGEGILNTAGGAVEANERFEGALLTETDRVARLQVMRDKANEAGFSLSRWCSRATR